MPLLVMEFQGLASGDPNIDAHPVRYMTQEGIPFMLVQSFDSVGQHSLGGRPMVS